MLQRIALLAALALPGGLGAQSSEIEGRGTVRGRVVDVATASPISRVEVVIEGTALRATTDINGRYVIRRVPVGVYRLQTRAIGYTPKTVTNVQINGGEQRELDLTLSASVLALDAITVTAEAESGSAFALIEDRRAAGTVTNAIGAEEISRSPDSDAAQAIRRVPGTTVVGEKYVYVRGLGDRYSAARLNGQPLPSTEPDRKAVPLDLFPSGLLESIVTSKTYSPDQPGDYSGGLVDIQTKDFPGGRSLQFSASAGYNSNTTFQDGFRYPGGSRDFLGIDDGTRGLPARVPTGVRVIDALLGDQEVQEIGRSFENVWQPRDNTIPLNQSYSLSYADGIGDWFGFVSAATYSNSFSTSDLVERIIVAADANEAPETDYTGLQTERTVRWSLFGKANILLSPTNQFTVRSLFSRSAEDVARSLAGFNRDRSTDLRNDRLRFISRTLSSTTLEGEHELAALQGTRVQWRAGYGVSTSDEPDRRDMVYEMEEDGSFVWRELTNSGLRYFTELQDRDLTGAVDVSIPFAYGSAAMLKVGGLVLDKERDFFTRRFRFRQDGPLGGAEGLPPEQLFASANIAPGLLELQEDTRRTDNYDGFQNTVAGYAMFDVPIGDFRIFGGARLERVEQRVQPLDLFDLGLDPLPEAVIDNTDLLPGLNVTWSPREEMNIRAAVSRTVARPQFREQAPFDFVDFAGGFLQVGNPGLERSSIVNHDARWEWFPQPGLLWAISGFYKDFTSPIEAIVFPSSELISTWENAASAEVYGVEVEFRTRLGALAEWLDNVRLGGNLTLIESSVQTGDSLGLPDGTSIPVSPRERGLQGQSPYVINVAATYQSADGDAAVSVLFNRFGRRIDKVGTEFLPDVFETARDQLDLVMRYQLSPVLGVKLNTTNLLNANSAFEQASQIVRTATRGRSVSVGLSFGLGS